MSNSFMSPLPTFTLESLITDGQWEAAQSGGPKKAVVKNGLNKRNETASAGKDKPAKPAL